MRNGMLSNWFINWETKMFDRCNTLCFNLASFILVLFRLSEMTR